MIGEIVGVHGVRGACKVRSYGGPETLFAAGAQFDAVGRDGRSQMLTVEWAKPHGKGLVMAFAGVADRRAAEALVGVGLYVDRNALPALEDGSYYWFELIGMAVYATDGSYLGELRDVIQTGSNDVYVVKHDERETLVPALENVVTAIDLDKKEMRVDLPEGL